MNESVSQVAILLFVAAGGTAVALTRSVFAQGQSNQQEFCETMEWAMGIEPTSNAVNLLISVVHRGRWASNGVHNRSDFFNRVPVRIAD